MSEEPAHLKEEEQQRQFAPPGRATEAAQRSSETTPVVASSKRRRVKPLPMAVACVFSLLALYFLFAPLEGNAAGTPAAGRGTGRRTARALEVPGGEQPHWSDAWIPPHLRRHSPEEQARHMQHQASVVSTQERHLLGRTRTRTHWMDYLLPDTLLGESDLKQAQFVQQMMREAAHQGRPWSDCVSEKLRAAGYSSDREQLREGEYQICPMGCMDEDLAEATGQGSLLEKLSVSGNGNVPDLEQTAQGVSGSTPSLLCPDGCVAVDPSLELSLKERVANRPGEVAGLVRAHLPNMQQEPREKTSFMETLTAVPKRAAAALGCPYLEATGQDPDSVQMPDSHPGKHQEL